MIEIKNLKKFFGTKIAVDIDELTIPDGTIFSLFGINGSGKSTMLRLLSGVYRQDEGEITFNGRPISEDAVRKDFLYIADDPLSKGESLDSLFLYYSTFYGLQKEKFEHYLSLFSISLKDRQLRHYSKGMKRRVYLAIALAIAPKVIMLDEAFDGLDIVGKSIFKQEIVKILEDDPEKIVIVASHSIKEMDDLADHFIILKEGKIVLDSADAQRSNGVKVEIGFAQPFDFSIFTQYGFTIQHASNKVATLLKATTDKEVIPFLEKFDPVLIDVSPITTEDLFWLKAEVMNDVC